MRRFHFALTFAAWLGATALQAQPVTDPVADLFIPRPPVPPGVAGQPAVLRPPEAPAGGFTLPAGARPAAPRRPIFALKPGERVLFLGDAVLAAEADHGYFETRLQSHDPTNRFTFRNLSRSPHNRLRDADPAVAARSFGWLEPLLSEVRALDPTVVVVSYGTGPALRGPEAMPAFTNVYQRFLEGLLSVNTGAPPRLLLLSPLSFEPQGAGTLADVTNRNAGILQFAQAAWVLSTNHNADFVDLFGMSRADVLAALRTAGEAKPRPALTEDGQRPTAFGARRLGFAFDRSLRWPAGNWRFGLMADGSWRDGGFGARIRSQDRSDTQAKVVFTEERLPVPNPPVDLKLEAESQPQCFIQVRGLKEGLYELRVDGKPVLTGTHAEWDRYEIICRGPSWDQAEELRQAIVKKNAAWFDWWKTQPGASQQRAAASPPEVAEIEARIARLKQPVERTYEVVRIGDAPAPAPAR